MFRDTLLLLVFIWTHNPFKYPISQLAQLCVSGLCIVVGRAMYSGGSQKVENIRHLGPIWMEGEKRGVE